MPEIMEKLRIGEAPAPRRRRNRRTNTRIINPNNVNIEEEQRNRAWIEMLASINDKRPLVGTMTAVEMWANTPCAVVIYKDIKVLIPASEFFATMPEEPKENLDPSSPTFMQRTKSVMYHRMGSEIEFVGTHFANQADQLVAGSRKQALARLVRRNFLRVDRNGKYRINEGDIVPARVVSSLAFGVIVEVGGIDYMVLPNEISYFRIFDSSKNFKNGDTINVKITKLDRSDKNNIQVEVSIKQARPNPFENAKKILQTSSQSTDARYIGTVSYVDKKAVYVNLTTCNLQVRCFFPTDKAIPQVGERVFIRIREINSEKNFINGEIIHIA